MNGRRYMSDKSKQISAQQNMLNFNGSVPIAVFLMLSPVRKSDLARYGISEFAGKGFEICIFDLGTVFFNRKIEIQADQLDHSFRTYFFSSISEAITQLRYFKQPICIVSYTPDSKRVRPLYLEISKLDIPYICPHIGVLPCYSHIGNLISLRQSYAEIASELSNKIRLRLNRFVKDYRDLMLIKLLGYRPPSIFFLASEDETFPHTLKPFGAKRVYSHFIDLDFLENAKDACSLGISGDYIVFLDQYLPYHSDLKQAGCEIDADRYSTDMKRFFDRIEDHFGCEIVIAAHPKSIYEDKAGFLGDRKIIRDKMQSLVKGSKLVITHYSTGVGLGIYLRKPIMLLTSNQLDSAKIGRVTVGLWARRIASWLQKKALNINYANESDFESQSHINEYAYRRYVDLYLKHPMSVNTGGSYQPLAIAAMEHLKTRSEAGF
ncbi:MAG: hypothetical protein HQK54_01635 [Oligoflexales bacterium]|nr:hypothetical protein [Oligoflexales bacterium]